MKMKIVLFLLLLFAAFCLLSSTAKAVRELPGSLLFFPYYDTYKSNINVVSITNTGNELLYVRIVFVDGEECKPTDFFINLTGYDTFTFLTRALWPVEESGFIYAYVVEDHATEKERDADYLIGQEIVIGNWGGILANFTINAEAFQCIKPNPDGKLKLDGYEYSLAPRKVYFPRFFGQSALIPSMILLINLSGGQYFVTDTRYIVYNDNEVPFSLAKKYDCWEFLPLAAVSGVFNNSYLVTTTHDAAEPLGFATFVETGFMELWESFTFNPDTGATIDNPCMYAVLFETIGGLGYGLADLPFYITGPDYNSGMFWSTDPSGT
ncbi:MAG: hypothetical protein ACYTG7_04110 [Planctomycetota bacterium]